MCLPLDINVCTHNEQNIIEIALEYPFLNVFLLYMPVEKSLLTLFYVICVYTTEHSFTLVI